VTNAPSNLILASTSKYRGQLLARLSDDFSQIAPDCDETPEPDEIPALLAARLAHQKALSVANKHPNALIIGSDQVSSLRGSILGKPGDHANATRQLADCSGKNVDFYTAVTLIRLSDNTCVSHTDHTRVCFRDLDADLIESYLRKEQPYDCAGSFKSEGLGVVLFHHIDANDPTALIGLPLIWLANALRENGIAIP